VAGDDLGNFHQPLLECQRHVLGMRIHHDADERGHVKPQRLGREVGLVAGDVCARLLLDRFSQAPPYLQEMLESFQPRAAGRQLGLCTRRKIADKVCWYAWGGLFASKNQNFWLSCRTFPKDAAAAYFPL